MQEDRPVRLEKELKNLSYQVRKIGVNINQVVAKINAGYGNQIDIYNLAKVLKCEPSEIKKLEKDIASDIVSPEIIESLKQLILNGAGGLKCPRCGAPLDTRIARMYDLEDNLVLHPKAHCTKCPFQIHS